MRNITMRKKRGEDVSVFLAESNRIWKQYHNRCRAFKRIEERSEWLEMRSLKADKPKVYWNRPLVSKDSRYDGKNSF